MADSKSSVASNPRAGMLAIVRKRRAVVSEVRPFAGEKGVLHLVRLEYKDEFRPQSEEIIWELESDNSRRLLEPNELPRSSDPPMPVEDFDALVRAARWTAILPYLDPDGEGPLPRKPVSAPFHGAVQIEDYQMVPLLKALAMPRINLMIADDVGIGKTIEAGLILSELLIRRRIQRVLILTPASLRNQWQRDELWAKFALPFDVIDRDSTQRLKRTLGMDANPWRSCSRIISSFHYLRQPDVLEQFLSASKPPEGSPHLPWDLLIVDEVHNLMPAPFGEDSQLCRMLRIIAPSFEHRIFLTATPHNGHTRCFSGLLELLDPVRFTQTDELKPAEKDRVRQVVVRRLKREINARSNPPRFCVRKPPQAVVLNFSPAEKRLMTAFTKFRAKVRSTIASESKKRRLAGSFAIEILGKRLLSGPVTFADSWKRCKLGLQENDVAEDADVISVVRTVAEDTADDRETEQRQSAASTVVGAWMKAFARTLAIEIEAIDDAVNGLGIDLEAKSTIEKDPEHDARFEALRNLIDKLTRKNGDWTDERLVVFTEYKTTLDYLVRRLRAKFSDDETRILTLFGGMNDTQRDQIKERFNDSGAKVRILVATDAASEGLNLQSTARYLLHFDCPWNPSRLEQRNGRLDRHGQPRDVHVFHFASDENADIKFISYLIGKVDQIREDLGATGELFDEATHRCLIEGERLDDFQGDLDRRIETARKSVSMDADNQMIPDDEKEISERLSALAAELDFDAVAQHGTLDTAMSIKAGRPQLSQLDQTRRCKILQPSLAGWSDTIDETVRRSATGSGLGPLPLLAFSTEPFIENISGRPIFRPRVDTSMVHLAHPLMEKAVNTLTRRRFPGPQAVSRWTVRLGNVPAGAETLVLLHMEELAVNQLRETFHHWIQTVALPVVKNELKAPLGHAPALQFREAEPCTDRRLIDRARDLLDELEPDLQKVIKKVKTQISDSLQKQLELDGQQARREEQDRYQSRQGEVSTLIATNTIAKLEREIAQLKSDRQQGRLFENQDQLDEIDRSIELKQQEVDRRKAHYEEVRNQLARERERIVNLLIPKRYALQGEAQVFPVAIEIRFPQPKGARR